MLALLLVLLFIVWNGSWAIRHFVAEAYCNTVTNSTLNRDQDPPLEEIKMAIKWDRWNAEYWYKRAKRLWKIRAGKIGNLNADEENRYSLKGDIVGSLEEAVRLNPFRAQYHLRLEWEYASMFKDPHYPDKWLPAADMYMERAAYFAGENNPYVHVHLGDYWAFRSRTIDTAGPEWEATWTKACWHYKKAQSLERKRKLADRIVGYVWKYYPDKEVVRKALLGDNRSLVEELK